MAVLRAVGRALQAFGAMHLGLPDPTAPGTVVTASPADPSAALGAGSEFSGPPPAHPEQLLEPGVLSETELRLARELWPSRYR
ncbi:DUF6059 family protein [Actinacidiphila rubida]|uniref:DUF6059 family protein n=1 Tax=Actinacidiphila rubida TaxID=310780 RepID=UPI0009439E3B|nr:DUF6059 family protein [Actinacidiphila rubida]